MWRICALFRLGVGVYFLAELFLPELVYFLAELFLLELYNFLGELLNMEIVSSGFGVKDYTVISKRLYSIDSILSAVIYRAYFIWASSLSFFYRAFNFFITCSIC